MPEVFPMLPKIDRDEKKFLADRSGVWKKDVSSDFLTSLVNSLETGGAIADIGSIDSIPDVWARPLLFKMALFDIGAAREFVQGLHDKVVGEWRAILAMLALKNIKQINLRADAVDLKKYKAEKNEFARVFTELIPRESFNGDADAWLTDIYVIFYDGLPLAMTSPVTLVASAADYPSVFGGRLSLPWSDDGKTLTDPIKNLSHNELAALSVWLKNLLENLKQDVAGVAGETLFIANSLLKCISAYQQDVDKSLGGASANFNLVPSNLKLHTGTARYLNETIQGAPASIADSFVRIIANPARKNKKLLLVSPSAVREFAQQENVPPARFVVWQGVSADNVTENSLRGGRNVINQMNLGDTEYRRPEDFFYDKMAVLDLDAPGDFFPGALKVSGYDVISNYNLNIILPIKRELLELFSPDEIMQRLSFTAESDNDISLHFDFPLSGVNGGGADFRFTKKYSGDDLIYLQQEIPVIEIWPNIRREGWNKYYLYYENTQAQSTANADVLLDEMYYVEPWTFGRTLENFPVQGLKNRITARLDIFPEALSFNYKKAGVSAVSEIGFILLKKPELKSRQAGLNWKIGVDFGTSSTMLYFSDGKKIPKPLDFEPHLLQITNSGGARIQTFLNFISSRPKEIRDGSFLSIFHLLNVKNLDDPVEPILDGHIMSEEVKEVIERLTNLDSDLKWRNDNFGRRKVAAYIGQICLQALVEAAANGVDQIQWNFSYPTAFSQMQNMSFSATCRSGINDACENTDFAAPDDIEIFSESEATAYYFNKLNGGKANFTEGALCIDIGAGTTDITVISGAPGRVVFHTSVQYAGRYIFKPVYDRYELFNNEDFQQEYRQTLIDIDMRRNSEKYIKDLAFNSGRVEIQDVLQGCQLAVAGLFYYLGKIVGTLHEAGVYTENKIPHVFVGGNGSRIFQWLTGGAGIKNNAYLEVLEKMLCDASGLEGYKNFFINLSGQPKIEVASGMIIEKPKNVKDFFDEKEIRRELFGTDTTLYSALLSGAEFTQEGKKFAASDFISVSDVSAGINVKSLAEFEKFINCFNESENLWSSGIELDEESAEEIVRETNGFYVGLKGADPEEIFLEPVFIVELKNLMEMLNYGD